MLGSQFHPEFKSRPNKPHPLFRAFLAEAVKHQELKEQESADLADQVNEMEF
jgi:CTP synthase